MFSRCMRCNKPFPKNSEIAELPVGRRIAFDTAKGRLWVVCTHCGQWNLVPLEERWEAVEQCEHLATSAEATATASKLGIAQTSSGLELLRVGGLSQSDIANWRYVRRLVERKRALAWIALTAALLALAIGLRAGIAVGSTATGAYVAAIALAWFAFIWLEPPHLSPLVLRVAGKRLWILPWQIGEIFLDARDANARPQLILRGRRTRRFAGMDAAQLLAQLLPKLNGAECATASVRAASTKVSRAESEAHAHSRKKHPVLRPWERLVRAGKCLTLDQISPEDRLALEMAVSEEVEQHELIANAESAGEEWPEQEEIAGISDSLFVAPEVERKLQELKEESSREEKPPPKRHNEH